MVKVTLNKDLVPYAGPMPAKLPNRATPWDLTHNFLLARKLIQAVTVLYQLRRGTAVYSGYIYDRSDAEFKIRIHHKGKEIRSVILNRLGYGGVLHVEITTQRLDSSVHLDLLTGLRDPKVLSQPVGLSVG